MGYNRASPAVKPATLRTGFTPFFFSLHFGPLFGPLPKWMGLSWCDRIGSFRHGDLSPEGYRFPRLFSIQLGIKGKGKEAGMDLRCPTLIRRSRVGESAGFGDIFRWDTLGDSGRFHNRLDHGSAVKETTLYHPPTSEPNRQANQRVNGGSVGRFRP